MGLMPIDAYFARLHKRRNPHEESETGGGDLPR
jgi:hypothetical protein